MAIEMFLIFENGVDQIICRAARKRTREGASCTGYEKCVVEIPSTALENIQNTMDQIGELMGNCTWCARWTEQMLYDKAGYSNNWNYFQIKILIKLQRVWQTLCSCLWPPWYGPGQKTNFISNKEWVKEKPIFTDLWKHVLVHLQFLQFMDHKKVFNISSAVFKYQEYVFYIHH